VAWPYDAEVPSIERRDFGYLESLGGRHDGRINRAKREIAVSGGQLRHAQPVSREHRLWGQGAGSKVPEEANFGLDPETRRNQIGDFGDDKDRNQQRPGMFLEKVEAGCVVAVVGIDVRVQRAGIDQEWDFPSSLDTISSMRSETSWWPLRPAAAACKRRLPRPSDPPR
jgi:hypothetical protein